MEYDACMDSWGLRTLIIAAVILIVGTTLYGGVNLMCQMNMRNCTTGADCTSSAMCINQRCTPRVCAPIAQSTDWAKKTVIEGWKGTVQWLYTERK